MHFASADAVVSLMLYMKAVVHKAVLAVPLFRISWKNVLSESAKLRKLIIIFFSDAVMKSK